MLNKNVVKSLIIGAISAITVCASTTPAFALTSDLQYQFKTENEDEFYNRGESNINFSGELPDYLNDIYDLTPQPVYDSDYGANIIIPEAKSQTQITNAPQNAPVSTYIASPTQTTGAAQGTGTTASNRVNSTTNSTANQSQNLANTALQGASENQNNPNLNIATYPTDFDDSKPQYPITTIEQVRESSGKIGVLKIPKIGLNVTAYDGDTFAAMKKGIGHIASTSAWNSNVGLVGHNRGSSNYFGKLKNLVAGDEITYTTKLGTRTYVVQSVTRISENDWSKLQYTSDNRLTLLTCVEDVPSQRLCVSAVEKR